MSAPRAARRSLSSSPRHRAQPGALTVRMAGTDDVATVLRLRLALAATEGRDLSTPERRAAALALTERQLAAPDAPIFLATRGGRAVGVVRVAATRGAALAGERAFGTLTTAYVVPEARRHGVMRGLVEHAAHWCSARGLGELRLRCAARNTDANAAWEALGFTVTAVVRRRSLL